MCLKIVRIKLSGTGEQVNKTEFIRVWLDASPSGFFSKRDGYTKCGPFNIGLRIAVDYDMMLRLPIYYEDTTGYEGDTLVKMRLGGVSNRSLKHMIMKSQRIILRLAATVSPPALYIAL